MLIGAAVFARPIVPATLVAAMLGGLTGLLPIGWIVLNIIFLHQLTEQNTKTIAEVEKLRVRTARLQRVLVVMALVVVGLLVHTCTR